MNPEVGATLFIDGSPCRIVKVVKNRDDQIMAMAVERLDTDIEERFIVYDNFGEPMEFETVSEAKWRSWPKYQQLQ